MFINQSNSIYIAHFPNKSMQFNWFTGKNKQFTLKLKLGYKP